MESGIYFIMSCQKPERIYVGSCVCFKSRVMLHQTQLLHNCHPNAKMQNHVNKYSLNDLLFVSAWECGRESLLQKEQEFIDFLNPWFNINPTAGSRAGTRHSNKTKLHLKHVLKHKRVKTRSEALRGRF